ncbi:MAG: hypothetical protein ACOYJD_08310 [Christensenellales bacterium]
MSGTVEEIGRDDGARGGAQQGLENVFSQPEIDRAFGRRLARERAKWEKEMEGHMQLTEDGLKKIEGQGRDADEYWNNAKEAGQPHYAGAVNNEERQQVEDAGEYWQAVSGDVAEEGEGGEPDMYDGGSGEQEMYDGGSGEQEMYDGGSGEQEMYDGGEGDLSRQLFSPGRPMPSDYELAGSLLSQEAELRANDPSFDILSFIRERPAAARMLADGFSLSDAVKAADMPAYEAGLRKKIEAELTQSILMRKRPLPMPGPAAAEASVNMDMLTPKQIADIDYRVAAGQRIML